MYIYSYKVKKKLSIKRDGKNLDHVSQKNSDKVVPQGKYF